ncbi:MAG: hypothetical protein OCD02_07420 [Spirochaetaceae bacterium]
MKSLVYIKSRKEEVEITKWEYEGMFHYKLWITDNITKDVSEETFPIDDLVFNVK